MGRLQKKKTTAKAKKKRTETASAGTRPEIAAPDNKAVSTVPASRETLRRIADGQKKPTATLKPASERNVYEKAVQFLREVKVELKKVTWPTRKQTIGSTVVVIILVVIISLFLGVVDVGLSGIIRVVLQ